MSADHSLIPKFQRLHLLPTITPGSDLSAEFTNDEFGPAHGIDSNLIVDNVAINSDTREVEHPTTFGLETSVDGGSNSGEFLFQTALSMASNASTLALADNS